MASLTEISKEAISSASTEPGSLSETNGFTIFPQVSNSHRVKAAHPNTSRALMHSTLLHIAYSLTPIGSR